MNIYEGIFYDIFDGAYSYCKKKQNNFEIKGGMSLDHLHFQNILGKYKMGNCLLKCANNNKTLIFQTTPLIKMSVSGIQKNQVKFFAADIH